MHTLLGILVEAEGWLRARGVESPRLEAEWLLAHVLGMKRLDLYLQFDRPLGEAQLAPFRAGLRRRAAGEPLQYILGSAVFYGVELLVGPGVLVPRPETEVLVELALARHAGGAWLDLCTGSGAIPLAVARERRAAPPRLVGVDLSPAAYAWANRNRHRLGADTVEFRLGDLYAPVAGERFATITANPPYVRDDEWPGLPVEVRDHEPREALVAGADGLDVLRRIVTGAREHLLPGGWLLCEIGATQGPAAATLYREAGLAEVAVAPDYARHDRVVLGRAPA